MFNLHWGFSNINFFVSFFGNSIADLNMDEHYD